MSCIGSMDAAKSFAKRRWRAGFTLVELMVTIALIAILMMVAAPSFVAYQRNAELTSVGNSFLATLAAARAEAMKRGQSAYVVPVSGENWATGWTAYLDVNANQVLDAGDITITQEPDLPSSVVMEVGSGVADGFLDGTERYVRFSGSGYPTKKTTAFGGGVLQFSNGTDARRVVLNTVGRMRVCKTTETTCTSTGF